MKRPLGERELLQEVPPPKPHSPQELHKTRAKGATDRFERTVAPLVSSLKSVLGEGRRKTLVPIAKSMHFFSFFYLQTEKNMVE